MSYEPKEWVCGETITAEGLNNLEEGVQEALDCCGGTTENEVFAVNVAIDTSITPSETPIPTTADKTFAEIKEAYEAGKVIKIYGIETKDSMAMGTELNTTWGEMNGELVSIGGVLITPSYWFNDMLNGVSEISVSISAMGVAYVYNKGKWTPMQ